MQSVPGDARGDLAPRLSEGLRLVRVLAQASGRARELAGLGCGDEPGAAVGDDLERSAGVRRGQHRLLREERLVRHHPEVLVDGGVEDGETAGVERRELGLVDPARELGAPVQAPLASPGPRAARGRARRR